jgi:heat shock protein beta
MLKKLEGEDYEKFWKEYSTNIKLGIMEDPSNRARLAKLLRFQSSQTKNDKITGLTEYVSRMKPKQEWIYYIAASSRHEAEKSPFIERLIARGYEVIYLVEAVDEYCIGALPEFDGKKFQNVAKEGFTLPESEEAKAKFEELKSKFAPLATWFQEVGLKDKITKAQVSEKLTNTPCVLIASMFGWTGNMERLALSNAHKKANDVSQSYYLNQKKALEFNPRHPVIKELLRRVDLDQNDEKAKEIADLLLDTAVLRSGFMLHETSRFADSVDRLMKTALNVEDSEFDPEVEEFPEQPAGEETTENDEEEIDGDIEEHDEL